MHIKTVLKNEEGQFDFEGELSADEHALVMEVGLNTLLQNGSLPFTLLEKDNMARYNDNNGGMTSKS